MNINEASKKPERVRRFARLHPDTAERIKYWSARRDLNEQEYIEMAIENQIARENGDYNLPLLEQQRLNQIVDEVRSLSTNVANLEAVTTSGFKSVLGLAVGDSYLMDDDSGELNSGELASAVAGG